MAFRTLLALTQLTVFAVALQGKTALLANDATWSESRADFLAPSTPVDESTSMKLARAARGLAERALGKTMLNRLGKVLHLSAQAPAVPSDAPNDVSDVDSPEEAGSALDPSRSMAVRVGNMFWYIAFAFIGAIIYVKMKVGVEEGTITKEDVDHDAAKFKGDWRFGIFGCFENWKVCLLTTCCCAIRWGDTLRMAGFLSFWAGFGLFVCLRGLDFFVPALGGIGIVIFGVHYRQRLRSKFDIPSSWGEPGSCGSYCLDCLLWCFCACCAIIQEAREVEEAYAVDLDAIKEEKGKYRPLLSKNTDEPGPGMFSY